MNKAGLFGGGWEDYLDALNEAFDRHVAENMPPHPLGASVDAIMTGYPDDTGVPPGSACGGGWSADATGLLPAFQSSMAPRGSDLFLRNSAQTAPVMRPLGADGPPQAVDSDQGSAGTGTQNAADGLGAVAGYPEAGSGAYRAGNDAVIRKAVADYNDRNGYRPGDAGYLTPEMMKAWQMQESGGSKDRAAFESDPFQVNKKGDWFDEKAKILGLTKGQAMTPQTSAEAAPKWLQYKSWVHDDSGKPVTYKGVQRGFDSYNGGGVKNYGGDILNRYNQSWGK
jgi:hypothetical protein